MMNKAQQTQYESLYRQHVSALQRQGKANNTIDGYARALRRVTAYFDASPDRLTQADLETYFSHLVQTKSWSLVKVERNGLQCFYRYVLKRQWAWVDIVKPPQVKTLPDILTQAEIAALIQHAREPRYQAFIYVAYTLGLRLGEALNLQVGDIDAKHRRVHIRQGKGRKDRFVTLPDDTLSVLRRFWCTHKNPGWLFPAGLSDAKRLVANKPMDRGGLQKAFKTIATNAGIHKHVTPHSLRHCYGAHCVEHGLNLRTIQHEMGHECPKTTARYTQLTQIVAQNSAALINQLAHRLYALLRPEV